MAERKLTRREALEAVRRLVGAPAQSASRPAGTSGTVAPLDELVNTLEFEEQARLSLAEDAFASIAGSDRSVFDEFTFRPRMNVSTLDMDLSVELFGHMLFTPIIVGPISDQGRYHREGERATVAGASAARTITIVSEHTSASVAELASVVARGTTAFWFSVYAGPAALERARAAEAVGARALFVTVGVSADPPTGNAVAATENDEIDWDLIEKLRASIDVPVVLKGVMSVANARLAIEHGLDGIVVSNFGGLLGGGKTAPLHALRAIRDAVGSELPILVDGSFRRATDVLVALILGARGVLLGRPIMWALASYGADGVETLLRMLQSDLARCFAMLGASNLRALTPGHIKIHER